jgi:hypothetical protein
MRTCAGCGGVLGRDCFNEADCVWITADMQQRSAQEAAMHELMAHEHHEAMERAHFRAQAEDFDAERFAATGMGLA